MLELIETDFPDGFTRDCSHAGSCDGDVAYWLGEIGLALDPAEAADYLRGYGAWDATELASHADNLARILWIAAGQFQDRRRGRRLF